VETKDQAFYGFAFGHRLVGDGDSGLGHDLVDRGSDHSLTQVVEAFVAVAQVQKDTQPFDLDHQNAGALELHHEFKQAKAVHRIEIGHATQIVGGQLAVEH